MEGGLPMLNCVMQHTLRSLCYSHPTSPKWLYAVFWKILPRNYPPPKWDYGGSALDRSKGNKRNWILVWEDGFCDFYECERGGNRGRFGAEVFFKLSHEVYSFGEGAVGKVAADNNHKWVFRESPTEKDPNFNTSWNVSIDRQPKAWQIQFHSGIQTIALISVREGVIQLGSFEKIDEDLNLVISIQRKFSYLLSLPSFFATHRPFIHLPPIQNPRNYNEMNVRLDEKPRLTGSKRIFDEKLHEFPLKSLNLGYNSPQNGPPIWHIPPLFPSMPCSFGAMLSKSPFEGTNDDDDGNSEKFVRERDELDFDVKTEPKVGEDKQQDVNPQSRSRVELNYGPSIN